ncbi:MAG: NAD+ synthase [Deltaproteobacteria bacterium]|nr:MAG: NAD+ synthase [Deltaproteobacteria bacterium]
MKIALIQTNPYIGAFAHNKDNVVKWLRQANEAGCRLAVFPELTLCGAPPRDLLERSSFLEAHDQVLQEVLRATGDIACILGVLERDVDTTLYNSAFFMHRQKVVHRVRKQLQPACDIFDEGRYFTTGDAAGLVTFEDLRFGLMVCGDIWDVASPCGAKHPLHRQVYAGEQPDCLIALGASPYAHGILGERQRFFSSLCQARRLPLLYVNQAGGQDSLVFDGHSLVFDKQGQFVSAAAGFREDMLIVDTATWQGTGSSFAPEDSVEQVLEALMFGLKDYLRKTGFKKVIVGLSGGVDSAVTAAIACRALGPENVLGVSMPSPYTSNASMEDARSLAKNLGCRFDEVPVKGLMQAYDRSLAPLFHGVDDDLTEQNIQARIRGNILMALANKFGAILLSTGNKSELSVGYCTLYGDMCGGLSPLADVSKTLVYQLGQWCNRQDQVIPERTLTRPPSAELKPDQRDQDDLPPYEVLDPLLEAYLDQRRSIEEIIASGYDEPVVRDVVRRVKQNEYKRKQAPPGIKVTSRGLGRERRYPIVQGYPG